MHAPNETADDLSLEQMLLDQHFDIVRIDRTVHDSFRVDHHQWQVIARSDIADRADLDLLLQPASADLCLQGLKDLLRAEAQADRVIRDQNKSAGSFHASPPRYFSRMAGTRCGV